MRKKKTLKLEDIVDFSIDYYAILGMKKGDLPEGKDRTEKQAISQALQMARRQQSRVAHPDFGGSEEAFKLLIRAEFILSDPIARKYYESGGAWRPSISGAGSEFEVDWDSLGTYRKGTQADAVGYGFFLDVCSRSEDLRLFPAFRPSDPSHNYEWDWVIGRSDLEQNKLTQDDLKLLPKLVLSLVYDEGDIKRLTSGAQAISEDFLPFKIYICIPRAVLNFLRGQQERYILDNGEVDEFQGKLQAAIYSDYDLLETTSLSEAREYLKAGGKLEQDLAQFRDGTLIAKQAVIDQKADQLQWLSSNQIQDKDRETLKAIMRSQIVKYKRDDKAADFLESIPD